MLYSREPRVAGLAARTLKTQELNGREFAKKSELKL